MRSQRIRINSWSEIISGGLQGSILGPDLNSLISKLKDDPRSPFHWVWDTILKADPNKSLLLNSFAIISLVPMRIMLNCLVL